MPEPSGLTSPSQFTELLSTIQFVDERLASHASRAVNISLTVRNWLIGYYIVEFEQSGKDRAEYGDKLIPTLATELKNCLLYTSPSPRDATLSRMPSSA